ncbi:hypothetical protein T484DRAFT_1823035 [Baffinella frigidus]|nr:hypothetical protein T484DRAFT_1823035 [Cryptophyta sp. CCMP2293]
MRAKTYKVKAAHDELAKKMEERGDPAAAKAGERVQFIRYSGGAENIEDPLQVLDKGLPIDYEWYLTNQLKQPILKLFEMVMSKTDAERKLFSLSARCAGTGAKVKQQHKPQNGMMARFVTAAARCLSCNEPLAKAGVGQPGAGVLCGTCLADKDNILDVAHSDACTSRCGNCAGISEAWFLERCKNATCPTMYHRSKTAADLEKFKAKLDSLDF